MAVYKTIRRHSSRGGELDTSQSPPIIIKWRELTTRQRQIGWHRTPSRRKKPSKSGNRLHMCRSATFRPPYLSFPPLPVISATAFHRGHTHTHTRAHTHTDALKAVWDWGYCVISVHTQCSTFAIPLYSWVEQQSDFIKLPWRAKSQLFVTPLETQHQPISFTFFSQWLKLCSFVLGWNYNFYILCSSTRFPLLHEKLYKVAKSTSHGLKAFMYVRCRSI